MLVAGGFEFKSSEEELKKSLEILKKLKAGIAVVYLALVYRRTFQVWPIASRVQNA